MLWPAATQISFDMSGMVSVKGAMSICNRGNVQLGITVGKITVRGYLLQVGISIDSSTE